MSARDARHNIYIYIYIYIRIWVFVLVSYQNNFYTDTDNFYTTIPFVVLIL